MTKIVHVAPIALAMAVAGCASGLPGASGPQNGTREVCNWIAASAVGEGKPATLVDYVPIYASPIGAAFAYWPRV